LLLKTSDSDYLLSFDALARLLCPVRFQYLMLFLAFVRAAHYWTETHPEIAFRPVQECLTNIHRHSGSKTALIRLEREGDRVHVKVEDQGNGMSRNDSLKFSPTAREWESQECASASAIFAAIWLSNRTVLVREFARLFH
jgi:signal transduction histidine kinase